MKRLDRRGLPGDMSPMPRFLLRSLRLAALCAAPLVGLIGCSGTPPPAPAPVAAPKPVTPHAVAPAPKAPPREALDPAHPVMLGIDVLESTGFAAIRGKSIGLLTHPAGVDMHGMSTIEVLRHAPGVHLVALFAAEHGLRRESLAGANSLDHVDGQTGLMVHSLYHGTGTKPTRAQLKGIEAMVIDLQDVGVRSYTFVSAMKMCLEGCFENGVEVIVLDRPNPLGGLKVDGPPLDPQLVSYVGEFRVPYVHGLTIGELARLAKAAPDILKISDAARASGRLTVVAMRGWRRSMRWPDTRLIWVPTSQLISDFSAVEGYAMTGLGSQVGGFRSGIGTAYPFRGLSYHGVRFDTLEKDLKALNIPGIGFRRVSVPDPKTGKPDLGLYVEITDWDLWRPTELGLSLIRLACKYDPRTFATAPKNELGTFQKCLGSAAFYNDVLANGARVDVESYVRDWQVKAQFYQQQSRKYWIYN
jgi:uncharacterized protein YbbC (DUF1343 family)